MIALRSKSQRTQRHELLVDGTFGATTLHERTAVSLVRSPPVPEQHPNRGPPLPPRPPVLGKALRDQNIIAEFHGATFRKPDSRTHPSTRAAPIPARVSRPSPWQRGLSRRFDGSDTEATPQSHPSRRPMRDHTVRHGKEWVLGAANRRTDSPRHRITTKATITAKFKRIGRLPVNVETLHLQSINCLKFNGTPHAPLPGQPCRPDLHAPVAASCPHLPSRPRCCWPRPSTLSAWAR